MSVRRFPAPPDQFGASSSGGQDRRQEARSQEAPMQFEWEQQRNFPASPFTQPQPDGEPARKRTHYDAMEIDTPPRPTASTSFSTSSSNLAPAPAADLGFDAERFQPAAAFSLHQARARSTSPQPPTGEGSSSSAGMQVAVVDDFLDDDDFPTVPAAVGGSSSLTGARQRRSRARRAKDDEHDEHDGAGAADESTDGIDPRQLSKMASRLGGKGEFSFQVHHHHAPAGAALGASVGEGAVDAKGKWLHSGTPYVLLGYLQFSSLLLLSVLLLGLLLFTLHTLYYDIQSRLAALTVELRAEIVHCAKQFVDNRCQPETRLPVLARQCEKWEECMAQEVVVSGRTRVVAETVAEVVNGFVEVISLRTMLFVSLTLVLTIYGSSVALSLLPAKQHPPASPSPYAVGPPHFQHLGQLPPQYYAQLPQRSQGAAPGGTGWQLGPPSAALSGCGEPEGKKAKKGWL